MTINTHGIGKGITGLTELYDRLSKMVAEAIVEQLKAKPDSCLGLPTGNSPLGCYELLSKWSRAGQVDWSQAKCFGLDDYIGAEEEITFKRYLYSKLYKSTNVHPDNCFNPRLVENYDALIAQKGGLDLTVLGLGGNGHIAFNEPGTPELSYTHSLLLTESTRQANESYYDRRHTVPKRAVTMGIQTILASKKIILMVAGESKRKVMEQALSGKIDPAVPASYLSLHNNLVVLADFDFEFMRDLYI